MDAMDKSALQTEAAATGGAAAAAGAAAGKTTRTAALGGGAASASTSGPGGAAAAAGDQAALPDPFDFSFKSAAQPLDTGIRLKAEQSLGVDLGAVRVHQGADAAAANRELGSTAFARGQDVVLGSGVGNSVNSVMAHELAHVAQQRGAEPGVAMKAERGASGSSYEVEADHAASRIMIGAPATISQLGAERIMCFEGAEHMELGNAAYGGQMITIGKVTLPAGAFTALQGDFFGDFAQMEKACHDNPKLMYDYYDVLKKEGAARKLHEQDPKKYAEPDSNGPIMVASAMNGRSPMEYLDLAAKNFNHFSEQNGESSKLFKGAIRDNPAYAGEIATASSKFGHNIAQWLNMHLAAGKQAFQDGVGNKEFGGVGVAMDASALHYLTDAFASGHMRVPRMEMYNEYQTTFKGGATKFVDTFVDRIPNEIDVKAFITETASAVGTAASGAAATARSHLPGWVNTGLDAVGDVAHKGADLAGQGADALGISMPSIPELKISLVGLKAAVKAKLHPVANTIGEFAGEKIAGFSAKVLHDYDNKNGVEVHNDANPGKTWIAKGDHALAASDENEKIAKQCAGASATHIKGLHARGKAHGKDAHKEGLEMPFMSLKPILGLLPQISPEKMKEKTGPGEDRDWHWKSMNAGYRGQIVENAKGSIKDTVSSAWAGVKDMVRETVEAKIKELLAGLGKFAAMLATKIGAIVDKIMSYVPEINPDDLVVALLAVSK